MKLGGVKIINLDSLKGKFDLEEVWGNLENGVLLDCQKELAVQGAELAKQMVNVLEELDKEEGLEEIVSGFYRDSEWDLDGLRQVLKPLSAKSKDHSGGDFYSRNSERIRKLVEQGEIIWNRKKAALFFLFLILMLQVRPRKEITGEDILFMQKELKTSQKEAGNIEKTEDRRRLYPYGSGVFYLFEGKIVNEKGICVSPKQEEIDFFTYTERLGIIAFTKQGELSACTEANIRYEIRRQLEPFEKKEQTIVMAAACHTIYALLTGSGRVISNVKDKIEGWKKIRWIGVGLNSMTAIREKTGNLLELGSDSKMTEFSSVRAAYTWSEGICRYGILKEDGSWMMDDGFTATGVQTGYLDREGYLYVMGTDIIFRQYGMQNEVIYQVGKRIMEVCKYRNTVFYRLEEECVRQVSISEFC